MDDDCEVFVVWLMIWFLVGGSGFLVRCFLRLWNFLLLFLDVIPLMWVFLPFWELSHPLWVSFVLFIY